MINKYIFLYLLFKARFFLFFGIDPVSKTKIFKDVNLIRVGTGYGSWIITSDVLKKGTVCYCVGAGEDITFDCDLAENYFCNVFTFDPTPRAKKHFEELSLRLKNNKRMKINNKRGHFYKLSKKGLSRIKFLGYGIDEFTGIRKFYAPREKKYVSYSVANLDKNDSFILSEFRRLSEVMKSKKHKSLGVLKLDIEGAEYGVIKSLLEDNLRVKVVALEFDELRRPLNLGFQKRIKKVIRSLIDCGYKLVAVDNVSNYTFVKQNDEE